MKGKAVFQANTISRYYFDKLNLSLTDDIMFSLSLKVRETCRTMITLEKRLTKGSL